MYTKAAYRQKLELRKNYDVSDVMSIKSDNMNKIEIIELTNLKVTIPIEYCDLNSKETDSKRVENL